MAGKTKMFGEGILTTITNYIFWFLMGNFYFILMNIPLLILMTLFMAIGNKPLPMGFSLIVFACCIPIGPSATALFYVMAKVFREKDANITRDFFKAYRRNFVQSTIVWVIGLSAIFLFYIDTRFLLSRNYPFAFSCFFYVLIIYVVLMSLFVFPMISRFNMKSLDVIKLSAYLASRYFYISFLNFASFVMIGFFAIKISSVLLFIGPGIICYLIVFNERKIFEQLEERSKDPSAKAL